MSVIYNKRHMLLGFRAWLQVQGFKSVSTLPNFGMPKIGSYILQHLMYLLVCSIERTSVAACGTLLFRMAQSPPKTEGLKWSFGASECCIWVWVNADSVRVCVRLHSWL